MSQNLEFNKIFAAILVAGIVAKLGGFLAEELVHPHELQTDAVAIEGAAETGGGAAAPTGPEPILSMIATADVAQGEKISKACASCHSFGKGEPAKIGPNLWNALGHPRGQRPGFDYSDAMKSKGGTWTYEDLNKFLYKPKAFVPGTKMTFIGLKKGEDRAAIIAWLRTLQDSPPPLPSKAEIDAEAKDLAPPAAEGAPKAAEGTTPAPGATEGIKPATDQPPKKETSAPTKAENPHDTAQERGKE